MTNKQFRDYLNQTFPFKADDDGKGDRNKYKATKRAYGDYLWFNDRGQFNFDKAEYEAGRL